MDIQGQFNIINEKLNRIIQRLDCIENKMKYGNTTQQNANPYDFAYNMNNDIVVKVGQGSLREFHF